MPDDWQYPNRLNPRDRYTSDPVFRNLVQLLYHVLDEDQGRSWTPTELREAAMLAAVMYEETHVRPFFIAQEKELK